MKTTVNEYEFVQAFAHAGRDDFSREGLSLLFSYFDEFERDTGEQIDMDVIGICCDFTETTIKDFLADYRLEHEDVEPNGLNDFIEEHISYNSIFVGWIDNQTFIYANF